MQIHAGGRSPRVALETVIAQHGAWRVLAVAALALVRRRGRRRLPDADCLPDHIRRDIGLTPHALPRPTQFRF